MVNEELKDLIEGGLADIRLGTKGFGEAIDRATRFLLIQASLADVKLGFEEELAKKNTLCDGYFHDALKNSEAKQVTEKKLDAGTDVDYAKSRENKEILEAEIKYLRTLMDIFGNAHVTYRQIAKGD
ncbi:MAG: hypothetical protein DRP09_14030 [Candidatus Thorarchaeota archaeon]|nr:MAG: hypothetical protein DRP09_14030 [Candidatus Thorarchaeota archaeon]